MNRAEQILSEFAYKGNIGFVELVKFYRQASPKQIKEMEIVIGKGDWESFKDLINRVLGVKLQ